MSLVRTTLGDICEIVNGSTPLKSNKSYWENGDINWFTIEDIRKHGRYIYETTQYVTKKAISETSLKLIPENSILLCCTASVGEYAITKIPLSTNQQFNALVLKTESILPEYLFYFCSTLKQRLLKLSGKVTIDFVSIKKLKEIEISYPPLPVQKQIVEKLDAAFADIDKAISATEKNIENTEALFQEFLNRIYENNNWRQISLGEYYDVRDGTHDSPKYVENGFPLITSKNLKNGRLDFKKINLITEKDFREINKRSKVDPNDVLMAMIGTIGNPVVIDNDVNFAIKNVALFKTDSEQSGDFLAYYLRTSNVKNKMSSDSKGTTQKFIGLGYLRNFSITIPDNYEKQLEVVKEIKNFEVLYESLKRNYLTKSKSLEALKTSILNQAFSGELTKDAA